MVASIEPNNFNSAECSVGRMKKIINSIFLLPSCQQEVFKIPYILANRSQLFSHI